VEVIENLTLLKARLLECATDPARPGWLQLTVEVRDASAGEALPSLIRATAGELLTLRVGPEDRAKLDALKAGAELSMQVRLRAPGVHTVVPGSLGAE
jgi:hypothetical protein